MSGKRFHSIQECVLKCSCKSEYSYQKLSFNLLHQYHTILEFFAVERLHKTSCFIVLSFIWLRMIYIIFFHN
jgi:hypothetical protein